MEESVGSLVTLESKVEPDRKSVMLEFKMSKNFNSVGASVGFSSSRFVGESDTEFFDRVYNQCQSEFDRLLDKAKSVLGMGDQR